MSALFSGAVTLAESPELCASREVLETDLSRAVGDRIVVRSRGTGDRSDNRSRTGTGERVDSRCLSGGGDRALYVDASAGGGLVSEDLQDSGDLDLRRLEGPGERDRLVGIDAGDLGMTPVERCLGDRSVGAEVAPDVDLANAAVLALYAAASASRARRPKSARVFASCTEGSFLELAKR